MVKNPHQDGVLSFRGHLQSGMMDFVSGFKQTDLAADVLAEFVIVLANFQEEGNRLFPAVFIGESLKEILAVTGGNDPIAVGKGPKNRASVRRAFKHFAPLTEGREWGAYVALEKETISYGIFRTDQSPLNPTAFERLRQSQNPKLHILGLSRLGGSFVEVRSAGGQYQYVNLSGDYEEAKNPPKLIQDFMKIVTRDASQDLKPHLRSFYYRLGVHILHANHGTLLAVIPCNRKVPGIFQDGILLDERIHVSDTILDVLSKNDTDSFQRLIAWSQLIRRMTRMDGITLVDTSGAIVGYNCFISNSALEANLKSPAMGGARRRAFEVLRSHLGDKIVGVIYKSQDGVIDIGIPQDITLESPSQESITTSESEP